MLDSTPQPPCVSVIIPVFNGERYLAEALASVEAQTRPADEILVVNDGSTDRTPQRLAECAGPRLRALHRAHSGIAATRNAGVAQARGEWIAFLDADDLWMPEKLSLQLAAVGQHPGAQIILGGLEQFVSPELTAAERAALAIPHPQSNAPHCGTMLAHRDLFRRVGLFDETLRVGEFIDWFARAREAGEAVLMLPQMLMRRRRHLANSTRQPGAGLTDLARLLKHSLDRRRNATRPPAP